MARTEAPERSSAGNALLAALPDAEYDRLASYLEPTNLASRALLVEAGQPISHVYFPTSAVASLLNSTEGGADLGVEVGMVGREGMVGLGVFLGTKSEGSRCMVQLKGRALRMKADDFRRRVGRDSALHGLLLRYTAAFLAQVSQSLACNSRHPLEKRLSKWLLMMHSRAGGGQIQLTHEFLAAMLGVRRASVTEAARRLKTAGVISYERGVMSVLDAARLEAHACGCYQVTQREMRRIFE